jgi:glycosyltransferase involved in cell wall biosynthesis
VKMLVLIPAYNEAQSLPGVIRGVRLHVPDAEILVVDDGSSDGTPAVLQRLDVRWVRLSQRLGTGAAVRTGLRYAAARRFDVVVRIDGDGQHPPEEIRQLLEPLQRGDADVVIGSRYATGQTSWTPPTRRFLHAMLARVLSLVTRQRLTDPTSGFCAFGRRAMDLLIEHHPSGYPEPELLLFLSRNAIDVVEVPVHMLARTAGRTSLTPHRTWNAVARLLLLLVVVPLRSVVGTSRD